MRCASRVTASGVRRGAPPSRPRRSLVLLAAPAGAAAAAAAPQVQARSGILIGRRTGKVLWSKDAGPAAGPGLVHQDHDGAARARALPRPRPPGARARQRHRTAGGRHRAPAGDRITVRQALRGLLVKSANDAAVTLAVAVDGSERAFVRRMNRRAAPARPHRHALRQLARQGRHGPLRVRARPGHARPLRLARSPSSATSSPRRRASITWPPSHRVTVTSHNRLLDYAWGDGIKTGSTTRVREGARRLRHAGPACRSSS